MHATAHSARDSADADGRRFASVDAKVRGHSACDVLVLHSQTTMRVNYQPILYARNVRQCVRIAAMDKDVLRTGVRSLASATPHQRR